MSDFARAWVRAPYWCLAGVALVAISSLVLVARTYYYSDDFFLFYLTTTWGPGWDAVSQPVYGHFLPGTLWVYWALGDMAGLARHAPALFVSSMMAAIFLLLYAIVGQWQRDASALARTAASALALVTSTLPVSLVYFARGAPSLFTAASVLGAVLLAILAYRRSSLFLGTLAALAWVPGLLFWELAAGNAVLIPLLALAIIASSSGTRFVTTLRSTPLGPALAFGAVSAVALALYAAVYLSGPFGSDVPAPRSARFALALVESIPAYVVPILGGGPVPNLPLTLALSDGEYLRLGFLVPFVVGLLLLGTMLACSRLRPVLIVGGLAVMFQLAAILYGRLEFYDGAGGVLGDLRYAADFLPFVCVVLAFGWMVLFGSGSRVRSIRFLLGIALIGSTLVASTTGVTIVQAFGGEERSRYIARTQAALDAAPASVQVLSGPVPPLLGWISMPADNTRNLFAVTLGEGRWGVGRGGLAVVGPDGALRAPQISSYRRVAAPTNECLGSLRLPGATKSSTALFTVVVRVARRASIKQDLIPVGLGPREWLLPSGTSTIVWESYGSPPEVSLSQAVNSACILEAEAFVANP